MLIGMGNSSDLGNRPRPGRPRLSDQPGFLQRLYGVLPRVYDHDISVTEAARELDISPRSLRRYADQVLVMNKEGTDAPTL